MVVNIPNVSEFLKINDIKPSYQRIRIFEYLVENYNHPTVDMIYKELVREIPTLSKTTVYNTLNLFVEKGIVTRMTIDENETRYDADTKTHGHFKCEKCYAVLDFSADVNESIMDSLDGFQIHQKHIYFKGICSECLN